MKSRIGLFTLLLLMMGAAHAQMNALPQARHVLVYGQAQARAVPDRYRIEVSFDVVDARAELARSKVEHMMRDTLGKLRAANVPDGEIVATSLKIEPRNEYDQDLRKQIFKGIGVERSITARFSSQEELKLFLSGLETSEELQVSGVTTSLANEDELKRQLRAKAIDSTKKKAEAIAKSYGVRLVGLYSVSDTAPQFEYGIREGDWPLMYEWRGSNESGELDAITVTGSRVAASAAAPPPESFKTGYVTFNDTIYAVFLIGE